MMMGRNKQEQHYCVQRSSQNLQNSQTLGEMAECDGGGGAIGVE
jgi:hypothetical protein